MKQETHKVINAKGHSGEGTIMVPETLAELLKVYSEERVFKLGLDEYMKKSKKKLVSHRSKRLHLRLNDLSLDQVQALRKLGLLKL